MAYHRSPPVGGQPIPHSIPPTTGEIRAMQPGDILILIEPPGSQKFDLLATGYARRTGRKITTRRMILTDPDTLDAARVVLIQCVAVEDPGEAF